MRCTHCGEENPDEAKFCSRCGRSIGQQNAHEFEKSGQAGSERFASNIVLDIILTIITCSIYWFFWQARQIRTLNFLLKEQRFSFILWFFVSIITCFIFNVYYEYIMAKAIIELQNKRGIQSSNDLPVLSLLLSIFGFHVIADAIQQYEINKLVKG